MEKQDTAPRAAESGASRQLRALLASGRPLLYNRDLAFEDLLRSAARIIPLSKTMKEKVDALRHWARDRAATASARE